MKRAGHVLLASLVYASIAVAAPPRPNVIIIFCDDLGYADLGCYGADDIHEAAVESIRNHADQQFFIYLPHAMPHLEIKPPASWKGVSKRGPYGDVVAELDAAIGDLFATLKQQQIDQDTLVVFSSDNGPAFIYQEPKHESICRYLPSPDRLLSTGIQHPACSMSG